MLWEWMWITTIVLEWDGGDFLCQIELTEHIIILVLFAFLFSFPSLHRLLGFLLMLLENCLRQDRGDSIIFTLLQTSSRSVHIEWIKYRYFLSCSS